MPCPFYDPEIRVEIFVELYASTFLLFIILHILRNNAPNSESYWHGYLLQPLNVLLVIFSYVHTSAKLR